jgi:pimeloyl-ACP methyl ester carboxylesterase
MNIKVIETKLGDIEFSVVGEGIPILFIHGGHSNCRDVLSHKGFDLARFQLITPSRPGYGKTPLGDNRTPLQAAQLLVELMNSLGLEKVIVYGISAGGLTAIELASNHPGRVSLLILASAVSRKWLDDGGQIYKTARIMFNPKIEKFTWGMVRFFSSLFPHLIARSFYSQFSSRPIHKLEKSDVQELAETLQHYSSGTGFINDIDQNISEGVICKIECPTLIIHSENDNSVPLEHSVYSNEMIETSILETLDNEWGHLIWIGEDSKSPIEKVTRFIDENT